MDFFVNDYKQGADSDSPKREGLIGTGRHALEPFLGTLSDDNSGSRPLAISLETWVNGAGT